MTSPKNPFQAIRMGRSFEGDGKPEGYKKSIRFLVEATRPDTFTRTIAGKHGQEELPSVFETLIPKGA